MTSSRRNSTLALRDRRVTAFGLLAVVVVLVVGFIAYTANTGLPWQGRERYTVEVPNAERLINAADVRIGGIRVGQVLKTEAVSEPGAEPHARVEIAVDPSVGGIPVDSTAQVRPASVLGLTYVDVVLGRSDRDLPDRGVLPLRQARTTANLTDLFEVFDRRSAQRFRSALADIAGGLQGRGTAINATILSTSRLLPALTRVAGVLAAGPTRLPALITEFDRASSAFAPVSEELAGLVNGGSRTFAALARERDALSAMLDVAPSTETAVAQAFTAIRPGLDGLARLTVDLRPAARALPASLRQINATLREGVPPLRALPALERPLRTALLALDRLSRANDTDGALRKLRDLAATSSKAISALVPAQIHCNTLSLFLQGFAGTFGTQGTDHGPALASLFLSTTGAENEGFQNARPSRNIGMNPLPRMDATECESGNEPWTGRQQIGSPAGQQPASTRPTAPPPGVADLARKAGLLTDPEGLR
ncbi:MlaD family protein [Paraconexibacter sp.]|uniref:MlaD family protein n=1 Tax=Paraconexibacter sp. TaxID=2949640 RepID=UPI003566F067